MVVRLAYAKIECAAGLDVMKIFGLQGANYLSFKVTLVILKKLVYIGVINFDGNEEEWYFS